MLSLTAAFTAVALVGAAAFAAALNIQSEPRSERVPCRTSTRT